MDEQPPMKPWGPWATLVWAVLAFAVAQAVGVAVLSIWFPDLIPSVVDIRYDGALVALVTLVTNPIAIALLALAARGRGWNPLDYLGLVRFGGRDFVIGLLAIAALVAAVDVLGPLAGFDLVSSFQTEAFTTARAEGWLPMLALAVIIVGPAGEEILFRGFLFCGWVRPGARGVLAILVIALLWSALHVQYDWFGIAQVFLIGLVLGWVRWRSGSTTLTIVLHILVNLESTIETLIKAGTG
jgi:membrane protease YdiL (CAAX protease family)